MPIMNYKTGKFAKANQRKQMWVYVDKWVELHTELIELRKLSLSKPKPKTKHDNTPRS